MIKDNFFGKMDELGLALTYDDVRLKTGYSDVMPNAVDLSSQFSRNVKLRVPIVSAAMDSVTEAKLAISLAKGGGLGIIHRGMSPEDQAWHVKRVKYALAGKIDNPRTVNARDSIAVVLQKCLEKDWSFRTFPVVDDDGRLLGLLTANDFDFCGNTKLKVRQVMTTDLIFAGPETTVDQAHDRMMAEKKKVLPLVDDKSRLCGMYVFSDVARIIRGDSAEFNVDANNRLCVGAAVGTGDEALQRVELMGHRVDVIVIDTAHGDSGPVYDTLRAIKAAHPGLDVVVGNVSEGDSAKRLVDAGADGIKVGQGPGSICSTRVVAGVGTPQVSAVYQCAKAIRGSGVPVCADGGITQFGDVSIAIGAGAASIMVGSMLAGTDESPGRIVVQAGNRMKLYRGMGSMGAMKASRGARERYGQADVAAEDLVPEGIEGLVPYNGPLGGVMLQLLGGLRKGMGYVGAATIAELQEKANFHRSTSSGIRESHPHDISYMVDAPNYRSIES